MDGFGENQLNILLLCSEWGSSKGGVSTFNRQLAIHLAKDKKLGVYCYLFEVSDCDKTNAAECDVVLVKAKSIPGSPDPLINLCLFPPELPSPNVVVTHGRKFGAAAFFVKEKFPSCKWFHFVHVDCEEMGKYKIGPNEYAANNQKDVDEVRLCEAADIVVAVGPQLQHKYHRSLSRVQKEVEVFYPGLSEDFLGLPQNNIDNKEFHVYIFGRGSAEDYELKGFDVVANAAGKLGKDYKVHSVGVPQGEEEKVAKYTVDNTAITKDQLYVIEYCNDREQLKTMMCKADLVVMPSRAEAFGLIGLEALSAGVPVLVSLASGFGQTLSKLKFGQTCVVESDEPEEWANRIKSMKEGGKAKRIEEVTFIREQYNKKYQWDKECSKLAALFTEWFLTSGSCN